jgi:hypothetical protein
MEMVMWANVHIVRLLEVAEKEYEMNIVWNYVEWKTASVKIVGMKPQKILPDILAQYIQQI